MKVLPNGNILFKNVDERNQLKVVTKKGNAVVYGKNELKIFYKNAEIETFDGKKWISQNKSGLVWTNHENKGRRLQTSKKSFCIRSMNFEGDFPKIILSEDRIKQIILSPTEHILQFEDHLRFLHNPTDSTSPVTIENKGFIPVTLHHFSSPFKTSSCLNILENFAVLFEVRNSLLSSLLVDC